MISSEELEKDPQRTAQIKPFINKYNWDGINVPLERGDWKKERKIIYQLLLLYCMLEKEIYILLMFHNNSNREKQVIILMIPNG